MEIIASPAPEANSDISDQIINALMACTICADAARTHPLVGWIVMRDQPDSPDEMIARLLIDTPTPDVLWGHTLVAVQARLASGLTRTERQPSNPPEVMEIWFPEWQAPMTRSA